MEKEPIQTVGELIAILQNYPPDTEISHLAGTKEDNLCTGSLYVVEYHPMGDRDTEEMLLLEFSCIPDPHDYEISEGEGI